MFCSTCGQTIIAGLNYCKYCGAKIGGVNEGNAGMLSEASFNTLLAGIMGIPIAGLGIIIGLMSFMMNTGFSMELIIGFAVTGLVLLLAAEATFIWLLWSRTRGVKTTGEDFRSQDKLRLKKAAAGELKAAQTQEFINPMSSVTESETRPFETISRDIK